MTEKVKITQKQFDWLERYKSDEEIDYAIDIQQHRKRPDSPVADWKPSEVARALLIGYEAEPEYKMGQWIVHVEANLIGTITQISKSGRVSASWGGLIDKWKFDLIRHATPEEINVEKERQKWVEIEEGDVLIGLKSGRLAVFLGQDPQRREVDVEVRNAAYETWDADACVLYAKKVGATND